MNFKVKHIGEPKIIMSNNESDHNYFGWPTAVRLQNGSIAVGASGFRIEHICPFGKSVLSMSVDEGESYSQPLPVIDTVLDDRDTGLTAFGKSGLILTSFNNTTEFQRQNMPQTEECFEYINSVSPQDEAEALGSSFRISNDCGKTFGKIFKSPITSPHGPIVLNDGSILWIGNVYEKKNLIEAYILDPDSGAFTFRGRIDVDETCGLDFNEPYAIQMPDGKIICHIRAEDDKETVFTLFQTVSYDNGKTWSKPEQILDILGGAPAHLLLHSSGTLISAFSRRALPYGIRVIFSNDGGESWSDEHVIAEGYLSDDLGYPSTVELDDGSLLTVYYAREGIDPPDVIMQQKWIPEKAD